MFRQMLRSKIHRVKVTDAKLGIRRQFDRGRDAAARRRGFYRMKPWSSLILTTASDLQLIDSRRAGLGGGLAERPTARKGAIGDQIIIFCYEFYNEDEIKRHEPRIIRVDDQNRMIN